MSVVPDEIPNLVYCPKHHMSQRWRQRGRTEAEKRWQAEQRKDGETQKQNTLSTRSHSNAHLFVSVCPAPISPPSGNSLPSPSPSHPSRLIYSPDLSFLSPRWSLLYFRVATAHGRINLLLVEHFLSLRLQLFQISFKEKVLNSKVTKESCIHHSGSKEDM